MSHSPSGHIPSSNQSSHSDEKHIDNDDKHPQSHLSQHSKNNEEKFKDHSRSSFHDRDRTDDHVVPSKSTQSHPSDKSIKSSEVSHQVQPSNQHSSTVDTVDDKQPSMNDHGQMSFDANKPSDDGPIQPHLHTLSHEHQEQNSTHPHTNEDLSDSTSSNPEARRRRHNPPQTKPDDKTDKTSKSATPHPACTLHTDKKWLDLQINEKNPELCKTPKELESQIEDPPGSIDSKLLDRIQGSIIGMAIGDALGAHVEFRPYEYMKDNPVTELTGGGTWGLIAGQFTDDTSMALCLANSLVARKDFIPYDQLVRYKWWFRKGYMSSTGQCFDIGAATSQSIHVFEERQKEFAEKHNIPLEQLDQLFDKELLNEFDSYCSSDGVAGNGALMRLAPVPLFFFRNRYEAVEFSGRSGEITHGDKKAQDACRYYGALIVAALRGYSKERILAGNFYTAHRHWFGDEPLHADIQEIAEGSYKKRAGYRGGIAGKGYIVKALEAALWAFWFNEEVPEKIPHKEAAERAVLEKEWRAKTPFERGALLAVNLGDDTDTTAAIYGQLAGAHYGYKALPKRWVDQVFAREFMEKLSKWIAYEGDLWSKARLNSAGETKK